MAPSSSGSGHWPLTPKITGSNPVGVTSEIWGWRVNSPAPFFVFPPSHDLSFLAVYLRSLPINFIYYDWSVDLKIGSSAKLVNNKTWMNYIDG
jgi:hypothetical protein